MRSNSVSILLSSVELAFRNFRRAGILKKRFLIEKLLPLGQDTASWLSTLEPAITNFVPSSSASRRVLSSTCATAAIDASASPRNPIVRKAKRSDASRILDVA